jgi:Na+/melibiose symporter-like transporter
MMARWTLASALGDIAAPVLVAMLAAAGHGVRAGMLVVAGLLVTHAVVLSRAGWWPWPRSGVETPERDPTESPPLLVRLGQLANNRELAWWMLGTLCCGLLDEVLVAFGALHLHARFGASLFVQTAAFAGCSAVAALGLAVYERFAAQLSPRRVLAVASVACLSCFVGWLRADTLETSVAWLVSLGVVTAPLYPIASAQVYRAAPSDSMAVAACSQLLAPIELLLPVILGWVADRVGLEWALWLLAIEPVGALLVLWCTRRERDASGTLV